MPTYAFWCGCCPRKCYLPAVTLATSVCPVDGTVEYMSYDPCTGQVLYTYCESVNVDCCGPQSGTSGTPPCPCCPDETLPNLLCFWGLDANCNSYAGDLIATGDCTWTGSVTGQGPGVGSLPESLAVTLTCVGGVWSVDIAGTTVSPPAIDSCNPLVLQDATHITALGETLTWHIGEPDATQCLDKGCCDGYGTGGSTVTLSLAVHGDCATKFDIAHYELTWVGGGVGGNSFKYQAGPFDFADGSGQYWLWFWCRGGQANFAIQSGSGNLGDGHPLYTTFFCPVTCGPLTAAATGLSPSPICTGTIDVTFTGSF